MDEVQTAAFVASHADIPCSIHRITPDSSLAEMLPFVTNPHKALIALDFDQTVKMHTPTIQKCVRGGQASVDAISELYDKGATFCIVTAANPQPGSVQEIAKDVRYLKLERLFRVEEFDPTRALDQLRSWGTNTSLSEDQLEDKLLLLLTLFTDRYPADLVRIGHSKTEFCFQEHSTTPSQLSYRLLSEQGWSGAQMLKARHESDSILCPVQVWSEFVQRSKARRNQDDRLFSGRDAKWAEERMNKLLLDMGYSERDTQPVTKDPIQVHLLEGGIRVARMGHVLCAKYNKPEALQMFIQQEALNPEVVLFADDNSDNVFNMYMTFASLALEHKPIPTVHCFWYVPPPEGKEETYDSVSRELMLRIIQR
mmetsp:Transcript_9590/g.22030  ORF Transcript_9590/g.22030 Transcript_9590/m.22030 type:complete len:368 (+) Transcript_9590:72-1175(+)